MKKYLLFLCSLFLSNFLISQSNLKYLDYIFPSDSIAGFDEKGASATALSHFFFGSEYKVFMYKSKRDFIIKKYGFTPASSMEKGIIHAINAAPCVNEDFESSTAVTGTTAATSIGTSLTGWQIFQGQNSGVNGSCLQSGCCPTIGSTNAWIRATPWTAAAPLGVIAASPFGGTKVIQLNDNKTNQGEVVRIQQTFPVTATNALFQFAYRAAMDGSGHQCCDQPYMKVELLDCMNNPLSCPQVSITPPGPSCATVSATGWATSGNISYTPNWITKAIDLSPYLGSCVTIKISVGDCDGWAHYGYAFFDCQCLPMTVGVNNLTFPAGTNLIAVAACGVTTASLVAPAGMGPYLWNGPGGSGVTSNTNQAVNTTVAGNYTLTMTPPGICSPITKTLSLTFSSYPLGGFNITNSCTTYTITNTGTGSPAVQSYSFNGSGAPPSFTTTNANSVVNFAPSTTYTISQTITNAAGCYTSATQVITTPAGPTPAFAAIPSMTQCFSGNAFTFTASTTVGTHTYNFMPSAGAPPTGNLNPYGVVNFTAPGTYTVTHTIASAGCVTATSSLVTVNATPTINTVSGSAPACAGQAATLIATGGPGALSWTGPNSYSAAAGGTTTISNFQPTAQGIYTLTANNNGCSATRTINLTMPSQPTATVTNTGPYCVGQTIQMNASYTSTAPISWSYWYNAPWTYWNFSTTLTPTISNAQTSSSGVFYFYVQFTNGCWVQASTSVTVNNCVLPIEITTLEANCIGNQVVLNWKTETEVSSDYFSIRRSTDGVHFYEIARVKAYGNSTQQQTYNYIDEQIEEEVDYYYQLVEVTTENLERIVDKILYSHCIGTTRDVEVYPIPTQNELLIQSARDYFNVKVEFVDAYGKVVKGYSNVNLLKHQQTKFETADLINGCYELVLSNEIIITRRRLIVVK